MIRTMLWKEYREHRLVWLTMLVVNCGALLGLSRLDEIISAPRGESKLFILGPMAALLVWGYGMICGAMLLAGEREEGTLHFLDTLPVSRFRLWLVKGQLGLLLLGGQIGVLSCVLAALRDQEIPTRINGVGVIFPLWPFVLAMLVLGLVGLAYSLFFSARGENVLHTIGMAMVGQIIAGIAAAFSAFAISILLLLILRWLVEIRNVRPILGPIVEGPMTAFILFGGLTLAAVVGSARIFSRTDVQRRPASVRRMRARASLVASWLRIVWLCDRQMRRLALGVLAFSLGLGVLFLVAGPLVWPVATLLLGVLCGVTVFSDEQTGGAFRFLGDQRLPLGRIWIIKTTARFLLLLLAAFVLVLPSLLVAAFHHSQTSSNRDEPLVLSETMHLNLIGEVVPVGPYFLMWLLYGFCAGQLCGLLSRKSIVAAMIATMLSALLVTMWLPSLAGIGLHFWQIAGPPLILLAAAAFLMRAWAANRLAEWRTYLGLSGAMAASLLWIAFGIWYRVIEIPDVPEPFDVVAYTASLPTVEENEAGQLIRGVLPRVESAIGDMQSVGDKKKSLGPELAKVVENGWPDGPSKLGEWMDKLFAEEWPHSLAPLPDLSLGMVVDPRSLTLHSNAFGRWGTAISFSAVLAARGLQQQARGDPAVFVENLRTALALSRNLRHHSLQTFVGRETARPWLEAVDLWLKKLRGRPDLLKRTLQTLLEHEAKLPDDEEQFRASYLFARNVLEWPEQLLANQIRSRGKKDDDWAAGELQTVSLLWMVPWEQARHERLLRVEFGGTDVEQRQSRLEWGGNTISVFGAIRRRIDRPARELVDLRACQLKVALRLFQEKNGDLPASLDALGPHFLKAIPRDPFGGQPFHYRRSRGEWIAWPKPNQGGQQPGMGAGGAGAEEVPVMPRADEQAAPDKPLLAAPMMAGMVDERLPPEGVPIMPHADEPAGQPLRRMPRRLVANAPAGGPPTFRFVPEGQGILWSVGEDGQNDGGEQQGIHMQPSFLGQDLIYLVPPPP